MSLRKLGRISSCNEWAKNILNTAIFTLRTSSDRAKRKTSPLPYPDDQIEDNCGQMDIMIWIM